MLKTNHIQLFVTTIVVLLCISCKGHDNMSENVLDTTEIKSLIAKGSFLNGASIPADIANRVGASHVAGKYHLTDKPFLLEGSQAIQEMGMGIIKIWFQNQTTVEYPYNSDWQIDTQISLVEMAKHRYYKELLDMPFKTFALSVRSETDLYGGLAGTEIDYKREEVAMYEFAKYLLQTYKNRDVVFVLHNWEGDWLMRGGTGPEAQWTKSAIPADVKKRIQVMTDWFKARQAGITRARKEIGKTTCKVYHAIEVNKVLDGINGIPSLTSEVLPNVTTDMVSWSCYDALDSPVHLWQGIDYIKTNMKPTGVYPAFPIMIGEIGIPENDGSVFGIVTKSGVIDTEALVKRWDQAMSVFIQKQIPYIIHWQVYCNEVKQGQPQLEVYKTDQMRGFWLIRPDGTKSHAATYLEKLIKNAGESLKK